MADVIFLQNKGSLLSYAVSRLRPEVFSHPIWVNFGDKEIPYPTCKIKELLNAASQLQDYDPDCACQVLLVCAVYQNYAGQYEEALSTTQQVLSLAEHNGLTREINWATWGASAICVQQGNLEQAAQYLQQLQIRLRQQNEWILANYVETVEQSLLQFTFTNENWENKLSSNQEFISLMRSTFDWLHQWGFSIRLTVPEFQANSCHWMHSDQSRTVPMKKLSSEQQWHHLWHRFKMILRGELTLQWVGNSASRLANHKKQEPSQKSSLHNLYQFESFQPRVERTSVQDPIRIDPTFSSHPEKSTAEASLFIYCLGPFRVFQGEQPVADWPSSKGKAIFKYLVTHCDRPVFKDVLMDIFWPDTPAEAARNNLNVAVYGLRQALRKNNPSQSHVLFINDCYLLNPEINIWLDCKIFMELIDAALELERNGNLKTAIKEYSKAEALYQGEFLEEDRYEDWLIPLREKLRFEYLSLLDQLNQHYFEKQDYEACIHLCQKMLATDPCSEEAHRQLMRCFFERGQSYLALRQYYQCVEALQEGLNIAPANTTKALYEYIQHHSYSLPKPT